MFYKKILIFSILFSLIFSVGLFLSADLSFAEEGQGEDQTKTNKIEELKKEAKSLNPGNIDDPGTLAGRFLGFWTAAIGMLALVFVFVAGVMYMSSAGNAEKIKKSAQIIIWVVLGLTATLSAYMILSQLFEFIE